ncbi:MAG TPA: glucosamine-6-phosphate deaminase [Chitinophagaceae bacterium]|nr:glucosamine-6-phosphate deaminase [Chitinophagaceae bacterium]
MEIIIEPTYDALGERAAADLIAIATAHAAPLICPTSGSTPAALYRAMVRQIQAQNIDYSQWQFIGLDEWGGMNGKDAGSCRHFVDQELFEPLQISENRVYFFDGCAHNLQNECEKAEAFIKKCGGLTIATLGLGLNGHVGMNEPGTPVSLRSHVAKLAAETQQVGQKYFTTQKELSHGVTLGLATMLDAKHIFLLANGAKKAAIVKRVVEEKESSSVPATYLKQHPHFRMYLDSEAAQQLEGK